MRVNPAETSLTLTPTKTAAAERTPSGTTAAAVTPESSQFVPTSDLSRYLTAARQAPEIRDDMVRDVATRLAAGELDTPEAATDTARSMIIDLS